MRAFLQHLLLALAIALATWLLGWWAPALLGAAWGWMHRGRPWRGTSAALASALGWALLLLWDASGGALGAVAHMLGGVLGAPGAAVLALTIAYAAMLGGCAARMAGTLVRPDHPRSALPR